MQPTKNQKTTTKNIRIVHFIVLGTAVFGLLGFGARYLDVKGNMTNPLIPESLLHYILMPYYYSSAMYAIVIVLQIFALYKSGLSRFGIIAGAVLIVIAQLTERFYYQLF